MSNNIANKRLLRDYSEILKSREICIAPLENNIFEWHGNLVPSEGRYKGIILHIIMKFPDTYPSEPPEVNLLTGIPHSNIIDYNNKKNYLCIDMLKNFFWMEGGEDKSRPYSGWSSAYTVESILLQLNCFLFDDYVENYDGKKKHTFYQLAPENGGGNRNLEDALSDLEKSFKDSKECKCEICGHSYEKPFPEIKKNIPERDEPIIRKQIIKDNTIIPEVKNILKKENSLKEKNIEKIYLKSKNDLTKENIIRVMNVLNKYNKIYYNSIPENIYIIKFLKGEWKTLEIEPLNNCNCDFCRDYRKDFYSEINNTSWEKINYYIDNIINNEMNIKNENILWEKLYSLGYNDSLKKINNINKINKSIINKNISFSDIVKGNHLNKGKILKKNQKLTFFDNINDNINLYILDFLDNDKIMKIKSSSENLNRLSYHPYLWERREQICFYTKENFELDILGFDISISFFSKSEKIKEISSDLDILSLTAYKNNIRKTVWNNEFQYWLPLYITQSHMLKGKQYFEKEICKIISARKENKNLNYPSDLENNNQLYSVKNAINKFKNFNIEFKPKYCLQILTTLMNTMCVNMMKDDSIISLKSLEGFCQFHRILLKYIEWYPELEENINETIKKFIEGNTSKYYIPSLGEFIILLSLTDKYHWKDIKEYYIKENFDRSSLWILKSYPELAFPFYELSTFNQERINKSWDSTKIGKRLLAFNIYFNTKIIKNNNTKNIIKEYDTYYGKPSNKIKEIFFQSLKDIKKIDSYKSFFKFIDYNFIPSNILANKLRESIKRSDIKKYHNNIKLGINEKHFFKTIP